jgi:hypothetical protein
LESIAFSNEPSTLNQYRPGVSPEEVLDVGHDRIFLAHPPARGVPWLLLGFEIWTEGVSQWIFSYHPELQQTTNHGAWGDAPWGRVSRHVDAAVALSERTLVFLLFVPNLQASQIWSADPGADFELSSGVALEDDQLIHEFDDVRATYHGVTRSGRAVFSDREELVLVGQDGSLEVVPGPGEPFDVAGLAPSGDGVLSIAFLDGARALHLYDDGWFEARSVLGLNPESVTWLATNSMLYEANSEVYRRDPYTTSDPEPVSQRFAEYRPRGRSVAGDFGTALRVESPNGWGVAFVNGDAIEPFLLRKGRRKSPRDGRNETTSRWLPSGANTHGRAKVSSGAANQESRRSGKRFLADRSLSVSKALGFSRAPKSAP